MAKSESMDALDNTTLEQRLAEAKQELSRREEVAVRRARNSGLSWAEVGTLLGVTRQTIHRKYKKVG